MYRIAIFLFALFVAGLTAGCDKQFQQTVSFKFVNSAGNPVQGVIFRYYTDASCRGIYKSGISSKTGEARISRTSIKGGISVLLEEPSLCVEQEGAWHKAWQEFIDPANEENFLCTSSSTGVFSCERLAPVYHT